MNAVAGEGGIPEDFGSPVETIARGVCVRDGERYALAVVFIKLEDDELSGLAVAGDFWCFDLVVENALVSLFVVRKLAFFEYLMQ